MRALLIDGDAATRRASRAVLESAGIDVVEAADGGAGLRLLERGHAVDAAFVEWRVEPVTGYAFIRALKAQPRLAPTRVALLTDEPGRAYHRLALEAGAEVVVRKPLTPSRLADALRRLGVATPVG